MDIKDLLEFIKNRKDSIQRAYGYENPKVAALAYTVKLAEEVGELSSEVLASMSLQRKAKLEKHSKETLGDEMADVIFVTMLLAKVLQVDIKKAMESKMAKIITRSKNK